MAVTTTKTNKPLNPRGNDQSPKGYNRAALYSGKALDFDGVNDVVTTANNLPFTSGADLSIVSYFKIDDSNEGYFYQNAAIYLAVYRDGSTTVGELSGYVSGSWLDTGYIVNDSKWYQVAQIVDNGTQRIYLNGQEIATQSGVSYNPSSQTVLNIGKRDSNYLNGQMANVRAFNVALTAAQVADLYNNPEKVVPTGVADSALKLWLPMQEGAGTTAYDGSGNGNHGTISGATWTHGIGAPVAQTAVIDWNKKENLVILSEEIEGTAATPGGWSVGSGEPIESTTETAPDGRDTASLVNVEAESGNEFIYLYQAPVTSGETYTISIWTRLGTADNAVFVLNNSAAWNTMSEDFVATAANGYDEWKQVSMTFTAPSTNKVNLHIGYHEENGVTQQDLGTFYIWGAALHKGSTPVLVPTFGTAQSSEVLLPQGLTTGRDITGVNLFENVRKQGALNLDGNSWAEVHDNASLDFGTGSFSLEAWVKAKYINQGSGVNAALSLGGDGAAYSAMFVKNNNVFSFYYNGFFINSSTQTEGDWVHIVGTYDETNQTLYIDGSQVAQNARSASSITNALVKHIGRDSTSNRYYQDSIAQPRIYNRALTAEEVARNYDAGKNIYTND